MWNRIRVCSVVPTHMYMTVLCPSPLPTGGEVWKANMETTGGGREDRVGGNNRALAREIAHKHLGV